MPESAPPENNELLALLPPNAHQFKAIVLKYLELPADQRGEFLSMVARTGKEVRIAHRLPRKPGVPPYRIATEQHKFVKLAETLMLYTPLLTAASTTAERDTIIGDANRHYIINTNGAIPLSPGQGEFDVFEWAVLYAKQFSIQLDDLVTETRMIIDDKVKPIKCLQWGRIDGWSSEWSLREVGQTINHCRYGRIDIVPSQLFPLEVDKTSHSKMNAIWMAEFCSLAYRSEWYVTLELTRLGFQLVRWIDNEDQNTQAFVAKNDDCAVISFRGTQEKVDWLTDAKFVRLPFVINTDTIVEVHQGFRDAYNAVSKELEAVVDTLDESLPIFVTGHSLGAALATLAAVRLSDAGKNIAGVYLYGSPRVGGADFRREYAARLGDRTFLHINSLDIITRVPPEGIGYIHVSDDIRRFDAGHIISLDDVELQELERNTPLEELRKTAEKTLTDSFAFLARRDISSGADGPGYNVTEDFDEGRIADHMISQYIFKFACSIVDEKLDALPD